VGWIIVSVIGSIGWRGAVASNIGFAVTVPLILATLESDTHATVLVLGLGFVIGVIGHLTRSRVLILTGILIITVVSAYFAFGLRPGSSGSFF
jgi:hypothetical protein